MRTIEEYRQILTLWEGGYSQSSISTMIDIPRRTIGDCINKFLSIEGLETAVQNEPRYNPPGFLEKLKQPITKEDEELQRTYSYFMGVYLGDGSIVLSDAKKQIYRLRITCDAKYPNLIKQMIEALQTLMPSNSVGLVNRFYRGKLSCVDISCHSKHWPTIFPFYRPGRKHTYSIRLEDWQKTIVEKYPQEFWIGLYQTDGSRFYNKQVGHIQYTFSQKSDDIKDLFCWVSDLLNIKYNGPYMLSSGSYIITIAKKTEVAKVDLFAKSKS